MNPKQFNDESENVRKAHESEAVLSAKADLKNPHVVLSLLEADQVFAAKQQTRFGRRTLSLPTRMMLWGLRVYVVVMFIIVVISVVRVLHGGK